MTKQELLSSMSEDSGLKRSDCIKALDALIGLITVKLESGEDVSFWGGLMILKEVTHE